mgnify:CR=1 FL=1|nr:MAG TPA: hypothetical protein [Caudoviricetes sp.]
MAVYLISYDLNKSGKNYDGLYETIKSFGEWYHIMDSAWFITSSKSVKDISDILQQKIDSDDFLLVNKMTSEYYGYLQKDIWPWIAERVK